MNDNGDYTDEMTDSMISEGEPIDLDDWTIEALLTGNVGALNGSAELHSDLVRMLGELRAYGHQPPPAPSAELAAILHEDIIPLFPVRSKRKSRLYVSGWLVAGAAVVIAGAGVAAAAHQLPDDAQRVVSRVVNNLTPFHVDPVRDSSASNQPAPPAGGTGTGGWVFPGGSGGVGGPAGPGAAVQPSSSPASGTGSGGHSNETATSRPTGASGSVATPGASPDGSAPAGNTGGAVVTDPTSTPTASQPTPDASPTGGTTPTPTSSSSGGGKGSTKPHSSSPGGGKSGAGATAGSPTATATGGATQNGQ